MRFAITVLAALMALGVGCSAQAEDCDASQASMNQCAAKELSALDADLNTQYNAQMNWLKSPEKKQALKDAQRKWLALRDADCLYQVGKREDSGSIWPLLQTRCLAEQTRVRVNQLKAYVACRQEGCPR
ncbi:MULTISPECIES: lysozyme inhibitor LprI family protein [Pseudomonas syringae group]|uniref:Lysozyme inhibitor LprI family protein n=2 Tax=Pseudomonas syringae group TaxID=136849 RepID=A0ABU7N559_PSEVI|nr:MULTISPECIES: lysozyme inhibitor LprI family protein [Pseudomonas syringae group]EKN47599.1 lipoprotein [Pseudomonas viridiflava UASWS0038]KPL66587.1 lipoprotein [Pseudomonas viridiflava]KPZ19969.1 Lipoprotein [Pseudomonas viridiflava]MEE3934808.1 lysozyme inhibitor LprI family protein [Pseudomonas viridiflava]MEE4039494.1 lysozyme inhibitor LprI family protein [Pseudomonas viridiflava]